MPPGTRFRQSSKRLPDHGADAMEYARVIMWPFTRSDRDTNWPGLKASRSIGCASKTKCRTSGAIPTDSMSLACMRFVRSLACAAQERIEHGRVPIERRRDLDFDSGMNDVDLFHQAREVAL